MKQIKKRIDRRDFLKVLGTGAAALSYGYAGGANYPSPVPSTMATAANAIITNTSFATNNRIKIFRNTLSTILQNGKTIVLYGIMGLSASLRV
jgi:hypothetical protein